MAMKEFGHKDTALMFLTSAKMEVTDQLHVPVALPPRKLFPVPNGQEILWAPEPVAMM
jgi:hypothetical protein